MKPKENKTSTRTHTPQEVADELDLSVELIRDYMQRGCPHDKSGHGKANILNPAEVVAWMKANKLSGKPGRPSDQPSIQNARLRKENALALKYETQVKRELRELVPLTEVRQWIGEHVVIFRNRMIGLPATVTPLLEGMDAAERQGILQQRIDEALGELANAVANIESGDTTA